MNHEQIIQIIERNDVQSVDRIAMDINLLIKPLEGCSCFLHLAAKKGHLELIKVILDKHPNLLNQTDEFNQTPLVWAASRGHNDVVQYLISKGAQLNHATCDPGDSAHGKTALHWAYDNHHDLVVNTLRLAGAHESMTHEQIIQTIERNDVQSVDRIAMDINLLLKPLPGSNCFLHLAAKEGHLELIKVILDKHPNLLNQTDELNQTPLVWAASRGHNDVVQYLISKGAQLNHATCDPGSPWHGKTALHWAYDNHYDVVVNTLRLAGAHDDENKSVNESGSTNVSGTLFHSKQTKKLTCTKDEFAWCSEWEALVLYPLNIRIYDVE